MAARTSGSRRASLASALVVGLVAGLGAAAITAAAPSLELATFDKRFRLRGVGPPAEHVVLVEIDDEGLESISKWSDYARVFDALSGLGARLIVSDIVFHHAGDDAQALVDATRRAGRIVHPVATGLVEPTETDERGAAAPRSAIADGAGPVPSEIAARAYPGQARGVLAVDRAITPYGPLATAAAGLGHIGVIEDPDGVFRRVPLVVSLDGRLFPCVPLEVLRLDLGAEPSDVRWTGSGVEIVRDGSAPTEIPTDARGQILVDFRGAWQDEVVPYVLADDVLGAREDPELAAELRELLEGKVAYVGVTGTGNTDLGNTPFDGGLKVPRVLGMATLTEQLLAGRSLRESPGWLTWLLCLLLSLLVASQAARPSLRPLVVTGIGALALVAGGGQLAFSAAGFVLPVAGPALATVLALVASVGLRLLVAERARRQVVAAFGRYLPPAVLDKVLGADPDTLNRAERKTLTIMFSDIVRFSSYCEGVEPEDVHGLLNDYFEQMVDCVFAEEGTVDKFIGDGVLAFFGDPLPQPDHALRAVRAARDMLRRLDTLNAKWRAAGLHTIEIRIGINTGPVVVGNVGSARRLEYTVLGGQVNRAQRLEAASRPGCLLMGEATHELVAAEFPEATCVGEVKGKRDERYLAWELEGPSPGQR